MKFLIEEFEPKWPVGNIAADGTVDSESDHVTTMLTEQCKMRGTIPLRRLDAADAAAAAAGNSLPQHADRSLGQA